MSLKAIAVAVQRGNRTLLADVSLSIEPGEIFAIVGPNGAGKSTLLNALSGDPLPSSGQVLLNGQPAQSLSLTELARQRAVVTQPPELAFDYTVRDVVAMGWLASGTAEAGLGWRVIERALRDGELQALADRSYSTLSSGEKQRTAFARAVVQLHRSPSDGLPRWLLLDEPTANLDVSHAVSMLEIARDLASEGMGIVVILHDLDLAARYANRMAVIAEGRLRAVGHPDQVLKPELLSSLYEVPIHVEHHAVLDRLVVIG